MWYSYSILSDPDVEFITGSSGQMDATGQIAGGPVIGLLGNLRGLRMALVAAGSLLAPVIPLLVRSSRQTYEERDTLVAAAAE